MLDAPRQNPLDDTDDRRRTAAGWSEELTRRLGYPVRVIFGRSRTSPVQVRAATPKELQLEPALRDGSVVRLHEMFGSAPEEVREALASWIRVGRRARRASALLGEWTERSLEALPPARSPRLSLETRGTTHDLALLGADLLSAEFARDFDAKRKPPALTWGRRGKSATRGSLRLGSFEPSGYIVRLHRVLDQSAVPRFFVRYVLFHELLHAVLPPERDGGRRMLHHGAAFLEREAGYVDYARALSWQEAHVAGLVRSARRGRPMRGLRRRWRDPGAKATVAEAERQLRLF